MYVQYTQYMHAIIYYTTPFSSINLLLYNIYYKTLNEKKN